MLTTYQRETLTALYASLDYLTCNDLPGQAEIIAACGCNETSAKLGRCRRYRFCQYGNY